MSEDFEDIRIESLEMIDTEISMGCYNPILFNIFLFEGGD